jgi:hypothetical protein
MTEPWSMHLHICSCIPLLSPFPGTTFDIDCFTRCRPQRTTSHSACVFTQGPVREEGNLPLYSLYTCLVPSLYKGAPYRGNVVGTKNTHEPASYLTDVGRDTISSMRGTKRDSARPGKWRVSTHTCWDSEGVPPRLPFSLGWLTVTK